MALKINGEVVPQEIGQAYQFISDTIENMRKNNEITDSTVELINSVCSNQGIPVGTPMYMTYTTFIQYIQDNYLTLSGEYSPKKKSIKEGATFDTHNNTYADNAYRLTDKPHPDEANIMVVSPKKRRGQVVLNPIRKLYTPNFVRSFEPILLNAINPFLLVENNGFIKSKDWINFPIMVLSRIGVELYIPTTFVMEWIIFNGAPCVFKFTQGPEGVESTSRLVDVDLLRLCGTKELLRNQLITHGVIPYNHEIESLSVQGLRGSRGAIRVIYTVTSFPVV